ncbi:MAG: DNA polymerase IV [Bdellovibrionales bacterium]|nr:DNA polymerase IV [Bdellovibrionales bacterium]
MKQDTGGQSRKIIHVDMDAFYASVEQRDNPELVGRPVVVGGKPGGRGVVAAASYEARKFGVRSAMPAGLAASRCPHAIFIHPRIQVYRRISRAIFGILREYSDKVEPLALDEAYLDVTDSRFIHRFATSTAKEIRERIARDLGLPSSAGVSQNKFLAKLASQMAKPNGLFVIQPHEVDLVLLKLTVRAIPGVGQKTEEKLLEKGIHTLKDLRSRDRSFLIEHFGRQGARFYDLSRGIDDREVQPTRERKSLGAERTYSHDVSEWSEIQERLMILSEEVASRLRRVGMSAFTITLKVTFFDFQKLTRAKTSDSPLNSAEEIFPLVIDLAKSTELTRKPARLLGISTSHLFPCSEEKLENIVQLELFS